LRLGSQRGFTLIELMISITLVAAIMSGMLLAMRGGLLSLDKIQTRLDQNRQALGMQRILTLQLDGAMPVKTGCGGQDGPFAFRGTANMLQMVSTYSIAEGMRGYPQLVGYQVLPDEGGTVKLMVYEQLYTGPASTTGFCGETIAIQGSPQSMVAAGRLASCRFTYHQMNPDTQFRGQDWVSDWRQPELPAAVRIEMIPAAPDATRLPMVSITAMLHGNRFPWDPPYEDQPY
jgi:prepilin-type N-terminal cleavage/methylation domain-containing protein